MAIVARIRGAYPNEWGRAQPNNGMHPTGISILLIGNLRGFAVVCGRVMPGVRRLTSSEDGILYE